MSETKHTPGPYRNVDGVIYCGELVIARMCIDRGPRTGDLLAAAPDMLQALDWIRDGVQTALDEAESPSLDALVLWLAHSEAAIAKAKGEGK
jgi:hypothetical protein